MNIQSKRYSAGRLLLGVFVLSAAAIYSYAVQAGTTQPPIPRGVALKSWHENGAGGQYLLRVIAGQAPKPNKLVIGTVVTDTDCDADAEGISHCHNAIKLSDGREITVIDSHEMHRNRCMQPGELIALTGINNSWVMGKVATR